MKRRTSGWRNVVIVGVLSAVPSTWLDTSRVGLFSAPADAQEKPGEKPAGKPGDKKPESSPEAINLYADAANAQNKSAFDVAVDQWEEFLKKFPKDPLAPKARHYLGVCRLQLMQFDKAAAAFEAVVKEHPEFDLIEDATLNLAWSLYSQAAPTKPESYAAPQAAFQTLLAKFPKGKYVDQASYFLGECHYNQGKKKEATAFYEAVVKNHEKSPLRVDALYALGVAQEEAGQFAEAGKSYDLFLKEFPQHGLAAEIGMRKAETLLQAGQTAEAEKLFAAAAQAKDFPAADHALSRQAFCLTKLDKFPEAAALYVKLTQTFPQSTYLADAQFAAGRCFYRGEKYAEAAPWLQKVFEAGGADAPEAAHWLCRIQLRNKQPAAAQTLAEQAIAKAEKSPFLPNLKMDRADALYDQPDKRAAATEAYLKVAVDHATHELAPQALYNVAFAGLETRQFDAGLQHADKFLAQYAEHRLAPDVRYVQAECQLQLGRHADAEKAYRELTAKHAQHPDVEIWRVRLGLSVFLQKKYADAVAALSPLVATLKSPDAIAETQFLIGAAEFYQDKFEPAAKALQASLQANAKWRQADETLLLLSRSQRKLNQAAEAKASVERMLKEFPDSKLLDQAHYRLGEYALASEDYAAAAGHYDTVLAKYADSAFVPYAQYGKGWSLLKTKQFAPAVASFTALLDKAPQHALAADAHFARALARRQAGDFPGAIADLSAFFKSNPTGAPKSAALYERGLAEVGQKNFSAAVATFESLLKDDPKYADADKVIYELAWAFKSQEKAAEATAQFARLAAEFPDSPLAPEANFHVGEDRYDKKQYDEAAKAYSASKAKAPQGEIGEKSTYKLGWTHFQLKQYEPALQQFNAQIAGFPQGALAADALFMKAECLFRQENFKEAYPAFTAAHQTGKLPAGLELLALLHGGQSASQLKQWADAVKLLSVIPTKFADSPYLAETHYELGWARQNLDQLDAAVQDYEIAAVKSRDAVGARARFMIGEALFAKKQHDDAVKQFQRVILGYGGDKAPDDVKNWQARSSFEAGRCREVTASSADTPAKKKAALEEARKFYQAVLDNHPQHELAAEAKKRLEALAKL